MALRFTITLALALAAPSLWTPLSAQAVVQPIGVSDADALAEQVRRLGANPLDLDALLGAAELSLRLDDLSAAGSFLARADKIAPGSARGQAVRGAILVRTERPGEALAQFARAEAMGFSPARFAADRGLAYDLVGDQVRAQREYRLALREGVASDETRRRYALSLGISGKQREALDELAPQIKRNDRAGWRTRAFVLAMGGDATEASRIASTMMPPGSAQGLKAFFDELPGLPAIDRAFAVHFGEVRATPTRLADARLAPQLAPLAAEPAPVQVAAVVAPVSKRDRDRDRRKNEKLKPGRVALAPDPAPVLAAIEPTTQPPAYQAPAYQPPAYTPPRTAVASVVDRPLTPGEQASLAAATLKPSQRRGARAAVTPRVQPPVTLAATMPTLPSGSGLASTTRTITPPAARLVPSPAPIVATPVASALGIAPPLPASVVGSTAVADPPAATTLAAAPPAVTTSTPLAALVTPPAPRPVFVAPAPRAARLPRGKADDILARIVANLSIPASELGIDKAAPGAKPTRGIAKVAKADEDGSPPTGRKGASDKKVAAEKPVDRKAETRRLLAEKKAAADKKELAAREAAEKKAARADPSRIWVQVSGGANEGDLPRAWSEAKAKVPGAFAGRQGYTTPLRATNRVLTGPFKTDAEARAYVNQLKKGGIAAFSFTSDAGQKVTRLNTK